MIRVAMLSYWHVHAKDYAKQALEHPGTLISAVWDELPGRGRKEAEALSVPYYVHLDELLASADIDAVVVDTPTNMHRDVMVKAARAGKHIFTEKVIASTVKEAEDILEAVRQAGVKLVVSLPRLNDPYTLAIKKVLADGALGELTLGRVRLSHDGATAGWLPEHFFGAEQCQGGAMIDLGCHPMYLTRLFLGMPDTVTATYGYVTGREVEDNAVTVLKYANGAAGIVEAGFVNAHSPFSIELHGTDGTLMFGTPEDRLLVRGKGYSEWTEIPLAAGRASAFEQWVDHIVNGTTADDNIALALDLTRLMEASNLSAQEGRSVSIASLKSR